MFSYPVKKIVSNFSWKKDSSHYKSEKRIQPYKQWICNYENIWLLEYIWLTILVHSSSHAQHSSQEHDFFRGTLLVRRATNVIYHHSNYLIKWSILLRYSDRVFILLPVTGSGMRAPNFKSAHDTATKITQNIVPTISSIYASLDWHNEVTLRHNYVIFLNLLAKSQISSLFLLNRKILYKYRIYSNKRPTSN